ncbi:MAG: histidine kinase dimerization/phospho-acceptor domain-containing protein [Parashewanella sp.]
MNFLQSIRFRIFFTCIVFSIFVTICYGLVVFTGLKFKEDELFNWHIAEEASLIRNMINKGSLKNFRDFTTAKIIIGNEQEVISELAHRAAIPTSYFKNAVGETIPIEKSKLAYHIFETPQGFTIIELAYKKSTFHILHSTINTVKGSDFYYIVDVTKYVNYDFFSGDKVRNMFIVMLLLIIVAGAGVAFLMVKMSVAPLTRLANAVNDEKQGRHGLEKMNFFNDEVGTLANQIDLFVSRTNMFIEREKAFSRDVSHELRTPLASSRAALELVLSHKKNNPSSIDKYLQRINRANRDMSHLIETFLLLGRESDANINTTTFPLYEVIDTSFSKHHYLVKNNVKCINNIFWDVTVSETKEYLSIVIDNLIRNALQHTTEGYVAVYYINGTIVIEDTGDGFESSNETNVNRTNVLEKSGVGLTIVKRLCEKMGWKFEINNSLAIGTSISIHLNNAHRVDIED